jgi:ribosomal protein S18 acetylase RimI-like enzyme
MGSAATSIRQARPEDAPLLAAAERAIASVPGKLASRPDEIDEDAVRKQVGELGDRVRGLYLVAERAGGVVGHAFLESLPLAVTSHVVRLTIAVHEGHQRQGIGRALMNELLRWARASPHVEKVELQVRSSNAGAIALYRSLGFVEEGRKTRRLKIGPNAYLDDLYMALWVGPSL